MPDTIFCEANGQAVFTPSPLLSAFFFKRRQNLKILAPFISLLRRLQRFRLKICSFQVPVLLLHVRLHAI
jgi:hypothetical protein